MHSVPYILGLDLGTASVGWAILRANENLEPTSVISAGVRLFELMGGATADEYADGKDAGPTEARRAARLARRQHQRRAKRRQRILILLQNSGLLPPGDVRDVEARSRYFAALDAELVSAWFATRPADAHYKNDKRAYTDFLHVFPYKLRGEGIIAPLWPYAFGRAIYHLSQRRGFQSNRKDEAALQALDEAPVKGEGASKEEQELGVVKQGIADLEEKMCAAGAATVGQYLASLSPAQTRLRNRFTARAMIKKEFDVLWERQRELQMKSTADGRYPAWLSDGLQNALAKAIFYQRPLKSQKGLVGKCPLERDETRASWNCEAAQEFRLLQKLNDLAWVDSDLAAHPLSDNLEHWEIVRSLLERSASVKFTELRRLLKLPKGSYFNFEGEDRDDKIIGNRMNARMIDAFGEEWLAFAPEKRAAIIQDVNSIQKPETLKRRGEKIWELDEKHAKKLARGFIDEGYCGLSKKALAQILPGMRKGKSYGALRPELYPVSVHNGEGRDSLPPVMDVLDTLRNPAVIRILTEARKVVNALVRKYGKPVAVRIELARDMKNPRKKREEIGRSQRNQEKLRNKGREKLEQNGINNPKRADIEKLLLAEECGWQCPYTGKQFGWNQLFGSAPEVEVEHILPYSRTFDDSFMNKTLCFNYYNRQKGNRIPFEAESNPEAYEAMLRRVKDFHSPETIKRSELGIDKNSFRNSTQLRNAKLERFMAKDLKKYEDFTSRQLNDTRHASRVALEYVGLLYGNAAKSCVQVGRGGVTSIVRGAWGLNTILNDGGAKTREDHRHHAVDAIAIACTSRSLMQGLQTVAAAQREERPGAGVRLRGRLLPPWESFLDDARSAVYAIVPSWRIDHRARGALHKETNYAERTDREGKNLFGYRVKVSGIGNGKPKDSDIESFSKKLLDPYIKEVLYEQLITNPVKATDDPYHAGRIRAVRVKQAPGTLLTVGSVQPRLCQSAANHHCPIFSIMEKGKEKWVTPGPVTLFEAVQRAQRGEPLVDRQAVAGGKFLFTLASGDCIRVMVKDTEEFIKIGSVWLDQGTLYVKGKRMTDARTNKECQSSKDWFKRSLKQLQEGGCHKIRVLPSGEVVRDNG